MFIGSGNSGREGITVLIRLKYMDEVILMKCLTFSTWVISNGT